MAMAATLSLGCYESMGAETEYSGVIVKDTLDDLPPCTRGKYSVVYYVSADDDFWFCDGIMYIQIDLSGQDGSSCAVEQVNGTANIRCGDGSEASVSDGQDGAQGPQGEPGADGADGDDGMSCTVVDNMDGTKTIFCGDGNSVTVSDGAPGADGADGADGVPGADGQDGADGAQGPPGQDGADGQDGASCTLVDHGDGTYDITCDGITITVTDESCTIADNGDGTATISCDDGTWVTVGPECVSTESPEVSCNDAVDNDCDGDVDALDLDCCVASVQNESLNCGDGLDNDCDGAVDGDDSDCWSVSRAKYKEHIHYIDAAERVRLAEKLLAVPLATYRYKGDSRTNLGFIIEDIEPSVAVFAERDSVDLYGYTSMTVATLQTQAAQIEALQAELALLRAEMKKLSK
jgi:hypothetical protein